MRELIDYIDEQIKTCIPETYSFGLCHLLEGDNERFPATIDKEAVKAVPDDRYEVVIYHRALGGSPDEDPALSFGKNPTRKNKQKVRSIVFVRMGENEKIDDIINAYPNSFHTTNYYFANVSENMTLIRDRDNIWNEEFQGAYKDRYQFVWMVYAIEFDVEYIKCNVCV